MKVKIADKEIKSESRTIFTDRKNDPYFIKWGVVYDNGDVFQKGCFTNLPDHNLIEDEIGVKKNKISSAIERKGMS